MVNLIYISLEVFLIETSEVLTIKSCVFVKETRDIVKTLDSFNRAVEKKIFNLRNHPWIKGKAYEAIRI